MDTLQAFLRDLADDLPTLSPEKKLLVVQLYSNYQLLENGRTVEEDDWNYISLGILMKQMLADKIKG
jgi:hypothetical protein